MLISGYDRGMRTLLLAVLLLALGCSGPAPSGFATTGPESSPGAAGTPSVDVGEGGIESAGDGGFGGADTVCPDHHHEADGVCVCDEGLILDTDAPCPPTFTLTGLGRCWCPLD